VVIDADVVIRFFTADDPEKARRFEKFLDSGKKITLTDVTFAEIYWTLRSFYKFPKKRIINALESLINTSSINCNYELLHNTLELLKSKNISLIDAYNAVYAEIKEEREIMSFDRGFDKLPRIKRVEP